jgi:RES domain-containing protein
MPVAWRITKVRRAPYDGSGAMLIGGRWNPPGRAVIYAADTFAGALLEILVHAARPRTLPGPHHAVRIDIPEALVEYVDPADVPAWEARESPEALAFGDRWFAERRSAVLSVPSVPSRPIGRTFVVNPAHPAAADIAVGDPFPVPWDERLF